MKYYILFVVFCLALLPQSSFAQKNAEDIECSTELLPGQIDYMNKTRKLRATVNSQLHKVTSTVTIPLQMHIIRRTDGTGGITAANLATAVNDLNTHYDQLDVVFEMCEVNYIDDDNFFDNTIPLTYAAGSLEYDLATVNSVTDKVNIFCVPKSYLNTSWSSFPAYDGLFGKDWTIFNNGQATNTSTLAHEIGHYFNLYHTHQGASSNLGVVAKELVDGSNCGANVGDELCDTPADPKLSSCVSVACAYTCNSTDSNGDLYVPDPTNIMSYSQKYCRTAFSLQQRARILTSLMVDRTNLAASCDGCEVDLTLNGVIANGTTATYQASNTITSTQTASNGSTVVYDAGLSITLKPGFTAASGSDLTAKIGGCASSKVANNYDIEAPVISEALIEEIQYAEAYNRKITPGSTLASYPNPFDNRTGITFELQNSASVQLRVYNVAGQQVEVLVNEFKLAGTHQVSFDATRLPSGMYYATLEVNGTKQSTKLIVQH